MIRFHVLHRAFAASALALGFAAAQANADALLDVNFDTKPASNAYGGSYTQSPGTIVHSHGVAAGIGVDGSIALRMTEDSTNGQSYWGASFTIEQVIQPPVTLDDLADLYYSFDMAVQGGQSAATNLRITVRFHSGSTLLELRDNYSYDATNSSFQTISGDLPELRNGSLANLVGATNPITVRVTTEFNSAAGGFGFDAGNVFVIDNIQVGIVPEPASMALVGLGGLAVVSRRRRA